MHRAFLFCLRYRRTYGFARLSLQSLTPQFAQLLSQLLYNQPELRPPVLRALKILVESNTKPSSSVTNVDSAAAAATDDEVLTETDAASNLVHLRSQAESWFAVLFNVFGSVGRDAQGTVGEVIAAWARIVDEKVSVTLFPFF